MLEEIKGSIQLRLPLWFPAVHPAKEPLKGLAVRCDGESARNNKIHYPLDVGRPLHVNVKFRNVSKRGGVSEPRQEQGVDATA